MFDGFLRQAALVPLIFSVAGAAVATPAYDAARAALEARNVAAMADEIGSNSDPDRLTGERTPLLSLAVLWRNTEAADWLLSHGADPNAKALAMYGATPLMLAAGNDDLTLASRLLSAGADINARDGSGDTALNWAAYYGFSDVADLLFRHGADTSIRGHGNAIEIAMRRGHQPFIRRLLNAERRLRPLGVTEVALQSAIDSDNPDRVTSALLAGANPNGLDETRRPWLERSAREGHVKAMLALLRGGADPNARDEIGFTALMEAARERETIAMTVLLNAGASVELEADDHGLRLSALHLAAIGGDITAVDMLLNHGAFVDALDVAGNTPMLWALYEGRHEAAALLLARGGNPDLKNDQGDSPRLFASANDVTLMLVKLPRP